MALTIPELQRVINDALEMQALLAFKAQTSFRVEGINLDIPANLIPAPLTNKLRDDFNVALADLKTRVAAFPNSV